jgi:cytochrome c biogenesis protein CcmG, thiol:disulfide interchange protein DsbE
LSARSLIAFLAVCAVIGLLAFGLLSKGSATIEVGDRVPDRALPVLGGTGGGKIADYRGEWVLVNLWASWCPPCRQETPVLERFWKSNRGRGIAVLGINVQDNEEDALAFLGEFGATYPELRSIGAERSDAFGATGVPENFLVDPRGRLALIWRRPVDEQILREQFLPLVKRER